MVRFRRIVVPLLAAVTIFFVTGELLARAFGIVDRLNGFNRLLYMPGPTVDLPYRLRPGLSTTLYGIPVRVNRLGLRGPEVERTPAPGVRRLLLLGDSVVFGLGVLEDETLSAQLTVRLAARDGGHWEVLNAGVPGYDAVAEARLLETLGLGFRPTTVIVGTSLNDYDVAPQFSPLGILTAKPLAERAPDLVDRSEFLTLLRWVWRSLEGVAGYQLSRRAEEVWSRRPPGHDPENPGLAWLARDLHLRFYHDPTPQLWERLRRAYADLGTVAARAGIELLIAIFPESYQVGTPDPDLTPQQKLLALCRDVGVRCIDLQPAFAAAGGTLFADAQHPNARGFVVAADALADALR